MKHVLPLLAALVFPAAGSAEVVTATLDAEVSRVIVRDGPSFPATQLPVGHPLTLSLQYTTVMPEGAAGETLIGYAGHHWMIGEWLIADAGQLGVSVGFGTMSFGNDHPAWDAVRFTGDSTQVFGNYGPALLSGATVVLSDASRTALDSTHLVPLPSLEAFSNGEFALSFHDYFGDQAGATPRTLVLGRIGSLDRNPDVPELRCQGIGSAQPLRLVGRKPLLLRATLRDGQGGVLAGALPRAPILRVLQVDGAVAQRGMSFLELDGEDARFVLRGGQWQYSLRAESLPGPGSYLVYLTSPDQNAWRVAPQCLVEVVVEANAKGR